VLDGDHTLWNPLDTTCVSEGYPDDPLGGTEFGFRPAPDNPDLVIREDGVRFEVMPGARAALERLHASGVRLAVASYNHFAPVLALLEAFGLRPLFSQVVAEWHSDKAAMLRTILAAEAAAGRPTRPETVLFVDDDPSSSYREMAASVGVSFAQMGNEVQNYDDIERLCTS